MTTTQDLSFPNRVVRIDNKRASLTNKLQNLVPRIGWLVNVPVLPKGNTLYDLQTNTLYFSNGAIWIPIANAASFMTSTDVACAPDTIVVIEPSTFITGTDVGVALVPRGTGGVSLSAPDDAVPGGNCRGNYAVDLQIIRSAATQVASGISSSIGGGTNNEAAAANSHIGGGTSNVITAPAVDATIGGGSSNIASGTNSCVPGGLSNTASGARAVAAGELAIAAHSNSMCFSCDSAAHSTTVNDEFKVGLRPATGRMTIDNLRSFDNDAAAGAAGLTVGMLYQTTGAAAAPLNAPGIVMIKQ
jgi:hypothetical protein